MNLRAIVAVCLISCLLIGCASFPRHPDRKPTIWEVITAYTNSQASTAAPTVTPVQVAALPQADASLAITSTSSLTGTTSISGTVSPSGTVPAIGSTPLSGTPILRGTRATNQPATTRTATVRATRTRTSAATPATTKATNTRTPTATPRPRTTPIATERATPTRSSTRSATPTRRVEPTPGKTATLPPSPPEDPIREAVYIRSHAGQSGSGEFVVVGEIINGENFPVYGAKIIGTFLDDQGNVVGAQEELTLFPKTDIEESNPFRLAVSDPGGQIESYELLLIWEEISIIEFMPIGVIRAELDDDKLNVTGELRNTQGVGLTSIIVTITFYDEDGHVVGVSDQFYGAQALPPGDTMPYSISIDDPHLEYDTFRVQAQGNVNLF
ncbi:MAG: FxLYD domain-containing protein [Chloroflexota bacterium]